MRAAASLVLLVVSLLLAGCMGEAPQESQEAAVEPQADDTSVEESPVTFDAAEAAPEAEPASEPKADPDAGDPPEPEPQHDAPAAEPDAVVAPEPDRAPEPEPEPEPEPTVAATPSWPRDGSQVRYVVEDGESVPDGSWREWVEVEVTFTFAADAWSFRCEGWSYVQAYGEEPARERVDKSGSAAPPMMPTDVAEGDEVTFAFLEGCTASDRDHMVGEVDGREGGAWQARYEPEHLEDASVEWDAESGLVRGWDRSASGGWSHGKLVKSDMA